MSNSINFADDDDHPAVILDVGSGVWKAGFAGDDAPRSVGPTVTGRNRYKAVMVGTSSADYFVGDAAQERRDILTLNYPMERGIVTNWDDMERIWQHIFNNELRVQTEEQPVLMTEPPLNPKRNREKMCEIMFETFRAPGFCVSLPTVLSSLSSGRGNGIFFDCGEGVSHILPIFEGYAIKNAIKRIDVAGKDITMNLQRLLHERGYGFLSSDYETVRDIKENLCYVAQDYKEEIQTAACSSSIESSYELPDGHVVTIGDERFRATEILFQPDLVEMVGDGIHKHIYNSIMQTGIDMRRAFFCSVIVTGGSTMFPGFSDRLKNEILNITPSIPKVRVIACPERKYSVWIGGSILASLSTFSRLLISAADYDEHGPYIVHKKCI